MVSHINEDYAIDAEMANDFAADARAYEKRIAKSAYYKKVKAEADARLAAYIEEIKAKIAAEE